jgi:hypothetical protein
MGELLRLRCQRLYHARNEIAVAQIEIAAVQARRAGRKIGAEAPMV